MSTFCTSCGTPSSGARFCTSCGTPATASVTSPAVTPTPAVTPVTETAWSSPEESLESAQPSFSPENGKDVSKKKILVNAAVFVLIVGIGVGAFFAGKSSVDLEAERKMGYDSGFSAGESSGVDRGDSAGYDRGFSAGKTAGCRDVFSFTDGTFDYLIPYDPFTSFDKYPGGYYTERSDC